MRIAQLAPLADTVPPRGDDPVPQLIHYLVDALVERGHDVTLFASAESQTTAHLHGLPAIRQGANQRIVYAAKMLLLEHGLFSDESFDVIHSHLDCLALPFARRASSPVVTTVYEAFDGSSTAGVYREFDELAFVSQWERQRAHVPTARWVATIYPGLPEEALSFHPTAGDYLAYAGPLCRGLLPPLLLALAHETGIPLRIAGPMPLHDGHGTALRAHLARHDIEYVGNLKESEEEAFLGGALAVIVPDGSRGVSSVTTVKALACGSPVVTFATCPEAELVEHGITGFVCRSSSDMAAAIGRVAGLERRHCRDAFEANFTVNRMVEAYLGVYESVLDANTVL